MVVESILNLFILPLGLATLGMALVPLASMLDLSFCPFGNLSFRIDTC